MRLILYVIGFLSLFVWAFLFCRYDVKKGQIKMFDKEKPSSEVEYFRSNIFNME